MFVTGWDSLALQAAAIERRGDGTNMALVVMEGLIRAQLWPSLLTYPLPL
jgi:hypothetical protein